MSTFTVKAQNASGTGWITSYSIYDYSSKQLLVEYNSATGVNQTLAPMLPGEQVYCTFAVNIFTGGSGALSLGTSLQRLLQGEYWSLVSENYSLGSAFNPNAQTTQFAWDSTPGTFTMTVYGIVPTPSSAAAPIYVVTLYGPSGTVLQQITVLATSAAMASFLTLYGQKEANLKSLESSGVASGYTSLLSTVLAQAEAEATAGDVTGATNLLNAINTSNAPAGSAVQILFLPLIAVVAVIAVVFAFMFMRTRSKVSYFQLVVEDQIKDLEGLTLRISKIDRASSSSLESVKDRLKRLVGM
ncbi:MAG TPA: hypothetical protein VK536_01360 [Candidatus Limnocylindrales bacterium]|nr:hypothetical protein [Candidatus Limnocylindrales bacterium]